MPGRIRVETQDEYPHFLFLCTRNLDAMTLALRASLTAPTRAITLHAPKANRSAMVGPRRAMTVVRQAHAGRGYESGE